MYGTKVNLNRIEARLRTAWTQRPGVGLRSLGAVYGLVANSRNFLFDCGLLRVDRAPIPVLSVGGLTVGGSGKTPLAAELARWLQADGQRAAIITPGYPDELDALGVLAPDAVVLGHARRLRAIITAGDRGAHVAILDDGFQHRRLNKDLNVVLIDADALLSTNRRYLPAGPFRDAVAACHGADVMIVTRRSAAAERARRIAEHFGRGSAGRPVALCALQPGELVPANRAAAARSEPRPVVAVAGIMKPEVFFRHLRTRWPEIESLHTFRDHWGPNVAQLQSILRESGIRGIVGTLKDVVRLVSRIGERTPLWYLEDRIVWETGEEEVHRLVLETAAR